MSTIMVDQEAAAFARQALLDWFTSSARTFPWRDDTDSYHVLIAEMMLRRTQARQVVAVYQRFIARYPDAEKLDRAPEEEILALLRPLGLSWRASNFKILAHELVTRHRGAVPQDEKALLGLTGVGPYVTEAVRCFAFGQPTTVIDTNTVRVAARYFGFSYDAESRRRIAVIKTVSKLIEPTHSASSNYALLDFAATICRARDPDHTICPLASHCAYFSTIRNNEIREK